MSIRKLIRDLRTEEDPARREELCNRLADQYQLTLALRFQQQKELEAYRARVEALEAENAALEALSSGKPEHRRGLG